MLPAGGEALRDERAAVSEAARQVCDGPRVNYWHGWPTAAVEAKSF